MITYEEGVRLSGMVTPTYYVYKNNKDFREHCEWRAQEIISNNQNQCRTDEQVLKSFQRGFAFEKVFCETQGATLNKSKFDKTDPNSFAFDCTRKNGSRVELKTMASGYNDLTRFPWISFNHGKYDKKVYGRWPILTTTFKNIEFIDNIAFAHVEDLEDKFSVSPQFIVDAKEFKSKATKSRPRENKPSTHFVDSNSLKKFHIFKSVP